MEIDNLLKKWLNDQPEIELAILFGSYATGSATKQSDIDIAIQLSSENKLQADNKIEYLDQLSRLFNKDIDLVDLRSIGQPLLSQIMKYGQCLLGSQVLFSQLAIRNVNSAQDFMPNIEKMLTARRERWLAGG